MRGLSRHTSVRTLTCCAAIGAAGLTGLIAGFAARGDGTSPQTSGISINLSAAEAISFRFPADWAEAVPVQPAALALASATSSNQAIFDPQPARYTVASAGGVMPVPSHPAYAVASASAAIPLPSPSASTMAMASEPVPLPRPAPARTTQTAALQTNAQTTTDHTAATRAAAQAKLAAVAATHKPKPESNAVLNNAQIASIKKRLNLTPEQEGYWPAVEAELRKMEYVKGTKGTKSAQIDMSKMDVQGLRDAGFPLVMSFSSEQRSELRSLAHLLGLEKAMSGI
jgi:hypothetical protein